MADYVINSRNFFIDSINPGDNISRGDDVLINLASNPIECKQGEYARLSVQNFSMYKSWNDVNNTNNIFWLHFDYTTNNLTKAEFASEVLNQEFSSTYIHYYNEAAKVFLVPIELEQTNHAIIKTLNEDFVAQVVYNLRRIFPSQSSGLTTTGDYAGYYLDISFSYRYENDDTTTFQGPTNRIMNFNLSITPNTGSSKTIEEVGQFAIPNFQIYMFKIEGDCNQLLGGNGNLMNKNPSLSIEGNNPRWTVADYTNMVSLKPSVDVTLNRTNTLIDIDVQCLYPCQRATNTHVYLRTNLGNDNIESHTLATPGLLSKSSMVNGSNILGKFPIQAEYINFDSQTSHEFFINLRQKSVYTMRLFLTDIRGRALTTMYPNTAATAATTAAVGNTIVDGQTTLGNLFFNCVLRIDLLREGTPLLMQTQPTPNPTPVRFSNLLTKFDYGNSEF